MVGCGGPYVDQAFTCQLCASSAEPLGHVAQQSNCLDSSRGHLCSGRFLSRICGLRILGALFDSMEKHKICWLSLMPLCGICMYAYCFPPLQVHLSACISHTGNLKSLHHRRQSRRSLRWINPTTASCWPVSEVLGPLEHWGRWRETMRQATSSGAEQHGQQEWRQMAARIEARQTGRAAHQMCCCRYHCMVRTQHCSISHATAGRRYGVGWWVALLQAACCSDAALVSMQAQHGVWSCGVV